MVFSQVGIKLCFHSFRIPFEKCPAESVQFRRILSGLRLEPFHNLINKDFSDFLVRVNIPRSESHWYAFEIHLHFAKHEDTQMVLLYQ